MQGLLSGITSWRIALLRAESDEAERRRIYLFATLALAFLVRFAPLSAAAFPLNDGGLFAAMIEDLRANSYVPPAFTSYNGGEIPFAYPPLGFYLAALLSELPGIGTLRTLQVLPLVASTLTVAAVYPLARRLLHDERAALFAVLADRARTRAHRRLTAAPARRHRAIPEDVRTGVSPDDPRWGAGAMRPILRSKPA